MTRQLLKTHDSDEQGARVAAADRVPPKVSTLDVIRRRFIAGLITVIPAVVTIYAVILLVRVIHNTFEPFVRPAVSRWIELFELSQRLVPPITTFFSLFVAFLSITAVGYLTRFLFVRRMIHIGEGLVSRVPLLKFFYLTPKEVIRTLSSRRESIKRVVLVEYPKKGMWGIAFATGEVIEKTTNQIYVTVFMPTTPNPTSGFLMLVPIAEVRDVNMDVESAVRMIISGGILSPHSLHTAPFAGLQTTPKLPTPVPLSTEIPPELLRYTPKGTPAADGVVAGD
ncbi:DUF502 domain-containing protein [Candidatus Poribacteria bacterium]|nr:DUF502 domain-containing protein [Candidatus Poribacteria bacterium]